MLVFECFPNVADGWKCGPCGRAQVEGNNVLLGEGVLGVGSVCRKTCPAWFLADESSTKFARLAKNVPNWAILSE